MYAREALLFIPVNPEVNGERFSDLNYALCDGGDVNVFGVVSILRDLRDENIYFDVAL